MQYFISKVEFVLDAILEGTLKTRISTLNGIPDNPTRGYDGLQINCKKWLLEFWFILRLSCLCIGLLLHLAVSRMSSLMLIIGIPFCVYPSRIPQARILKSYSVTQFLVVKIKFAWWTSKYCSSNLHKLSSSYF